MTEQLQSRTWEDLNFRKTVEDMVYEDTRFNGISEFIYSTRLCWSYLVPTACAGHGFIFFNPDWWDTLPEETRKTVVYHEALHLIFRHLERSVGMNPYISNIAQDHVINLDAVEAGFTNEGWDWCCDTKYQGWSSEDVYSDLMKGNEYESLDIDFDNHISRQEIEDMIEDMLNKDGDDVSLDEQKEKAEVKVKLLQEGIGDSEGGIGLEFGLKTKNEMIIGATFEEILKPFMHEPDTTKRRTFGRPSRRNRPGSPLIMPGRLRKKGKVNRLSHLVYVLDVSGSISEQQGKQFNNSAQTIKELLNPELMTVIFFDTAIRHEQTFTDKQPYSRIKIRAGGGTCLKPVYKRLETINPEAVLIFTDLMVQIPPEPVWETIWLVPDKSNMIPDNLYGKTYLIPESSKKENK